MPRYFIELAYKGTRYSGFQTQANANTVQSEVEKAFQTLHRQSVSLTGSSRTDAGVHAIQNYFHFDFDGEIHPQFIYKMNAILPADIVIRSSKKMPNDSHSRFDATSREYIYRIHRFKNPFKTETSLFFPYKLNYELMQEGAKMVLSQTNFFAFCKTNAQVTNYQSAIIKSQWIIQDEELIYNIEANRFLRGMVRLLTASLLKLGREQISLQQFQSLFQNNQKCGYSVPPQGLFLKRVNYPENYFPVIGKAFTAF
jgi:tRNA pseudouridine38-40 synthase